MKKTFSTHHQIARLPAIDAMLANQREREQVRVVCSLPPYFETECRRGDVQKRMECGDFAWFKYQVSHHDSQVMAEWVEAGSYVYNLL